MLPSSGYPSGSEENPRIYGRSYTTISEFPCMWCIQFVPPTYNEIIRQVRSNSRQCRPYERKKGHLISQNCLWAVSGVCIEQWTQKPKAQKGSQTQVVPANLFSESTTLMRFRHSIKFSKASAATGSLDRGPRNPPVFESEAKAECLATTFEGWCPPTLYSTLNTSLRSKVEPLLSISSSVPLDPG